jgi:DNA-binding transcriptional MerR regulator
MDAGDGHEQWTIGEFAERARTTVKTVRFYSDRGLLPEASPNEHRSTRERCSCQLS